MIRILLVDDHALVRAGYVRLLALEPDLEIVAECADADEAQAWLEATRAGADVMILDLSMPGRSGLDLLRTCTARWPALRVLVCTMHDGAAMLAQARQAGALGFITKASDPALLADAVRAVAAGREVLSPDVASTPIDPSATPPHERLSPRELEVLKRLLQGATVEQIARALELSTKRVANVQTMIRSKLGASGSIELMRYAREHGLID